MKTDARALPTTVERLLRIGFLLGGAGFVAFGVWMLGDPHGWFDLVPGPASDYGPFNVHLIRDVGGWYVASGVLLLFAATNPRRLAGVALVVSLIGHGIHAVTHIAALVSGDVPAGHWGTDLPAVVAPVVLLGLMLWLSWTLQAGGPAKPPADVTAETDEPR